MKEWKKLFSVLLFSLCISTVSVAESFRTSSITPYEAAVLPAGGKNPTVTMGVNDALSISCPTDNPFIKGLEIEVRIPKLVASYRDSEVFYLFQNVHRAQGGDEYDYEGTRLYKDLMPSRLSYVFRIPFTGQSFSDSSPYAAVLPVSLDPSAENLVLRTQLAMKGVPDDFFDAQFEVTVTPVLSDLGKITITLLYPEGTDLTEFPLPICYIDESYTDVSEALYLNTGMHHLSVISEQYRNELRTFSIDKATESQLIIELQPITTDITIQAPEGAAILLDGLPCESHRVIPVEPGEHQVTYCFSDYEVTRNITVIKGKQYTVSLTVDIAVFESE